MATTGSWLGKLAGAAGEAKARAASEKAERLAAPSILRPNEITGEYDASRLLMTTLGGEIRPLTHDDLAAFRRNVGTAQKRLKGGITARKVLDLSWADDRNRAQSQIRQAVPMSASNGRVRFVTSAGPDSKVSRHHVTVEFMSFGASVSAGSKTPLQAAGWLRKQPLKFDCDCERHTFWFRYISTIGGFNAGRAETGFPKIRNPGLSGVGCKHVLRVMAEVESAGTVALFLSKVIARGRENDDGNAKVRQAQRDAEAQLAANKRPREIKTTTDRQKAAAAARERRALAQAVTANPSKPKKPTAATRRMAGGGMNKAQLALLAKMGLSEQQIAAINAAGK
ncbi:hypothetical protein [Eoetvoesiella caeni]|uniref:SWIM-type domain-containing protein n=1 Tax=Eoetvoesiella caeni TaxID=645616 RepID=A0A366H977_9BURK|nr:hypothetical protein [Eoetvoesiella caeni]MCI2809540.1 hypothetical protein [Eoetvoesiella caeni]NYT56036.1 hypothetical protein [Eoetvoesiella caeni]RBP38800.1 hypothetical protein DFR37_10692 [Eoetvoesiella caeni]